jgi:DNA polymerase III subunit delta
MAKALHAIDYLESPDKNPPGPVCVVFGDEPFLKRQAVGQIREAVLGGGEGDFSLASLEGPRATLRDLMDELGTLAMFGSGKRLVVVGEADEFVTRYRPELEDYTAKPKSSAVLVLDMKSWPSNTRLYKAVASIGLVVDCSAPPHPRLMRWLGAWAKTAHSVQLPGSAAETLVEMVGSELGLLDQELAKLALSVGSGGKITNELVQELVGTWRARTTWEMLDAALDGKLQEALVQLDRLLLAGEAPIAILGQISASLRRLAAATRLVIAAQGAGRRLAPRNALEQAGVKPFILEKVERQLRRLRRQRGSQLYDWLLETDLDLKGDSQMPPRAVLERLVVRIAAPAAGRSTTADRR